MTTITSVVCTYSGTDLTVAVYWDTVAMGSLTIYDSANNAISGTVIYSTYGEAHWQPLPGAMISGKAYFAQVVVNSASSQKAQLLWTIPRQYCF